MTQFIVVLMMISVISTTLYSIQFSSTIESQSFSIDVQILILMINTGKQYGDINPIQMYIKIIVFLECANTRANIKGSVALVNQAHDP
ncbi:hypothetical protein BGZ60DRAFT_30520 [Tricladium varicosporioides]|nr:hypothetical protein BGZ60DRAFT_30520 [Hymenoscyphus varicosporioides]